MFSAENIVNLQMKINKFNNKRLLSIPLRPEGWSFLERNNMKKIKYWLKFIFLALADISMCECYNNKCDKLEDYCKIN